VRDRCGLAPPSSGRNALLESIRAGKALKKVDKSKAPKTNGVSASTAGKSTGASAKAPPAPMNIGDALKLRFASVRVDNSDSDED
jgi:hypothetical protein